MSEILKANERSTWKSFFVYTIFGLLILVFAVNFGPGSCSRAGRGGADYAALVDGETIRREEYALRLSRSVEMMRQRFRSANADFTSDMAERMGLKNQIIEDLVNRKLLAKEARRRGLSVTDDELIRQVRDTYGVKDITPEQYEGWVMNVFGTNVERFEDMVREELLAEKLRSVVTQGVSVSQAELKEAFTREHDRAQVSFVKVDPEAFKVAEPTAAQVDKLLAEKMDEVKARFERDQFKYRKPQAMRARQIVKALAPDASDADVARVRGQLLELKAQIASGADFAALAKQHSEDEATKAQGGDLGFFQRGQVHKAIEEAAFALKVNELTAEPVRSPRGMHLLQLTENRPAAPKELEEVKREVATSILRDAEQERLARADAEGLLQKLKAGAALESLTWTEQEERDAKEKAPGKPAEKPVRADTAWILKSQETIPRIGVSKELHDAIFALTAEAPLAPSAVRVGRSFFVVKLKEREQPDLTKFDSMESDLREQAFSMKRSRVFDEWVDHLRNQAEVLLNPELFAPAEKAG